jgi:hypothetical protein
MIFFDYLFYRICKVYSGTKSASPEFTAACIVALIQALNVVSVLMIIGILKQNKYFLNKTLAIGVFLFFLVINYIRYVYPEKNNYKQMNQRYNSGKGHNGRDTFMFVYTILSITLFFGIAIYAGSQSK